MQSLLVQRNPREHQTEKQPNKVIQDRNDPYLLKLLELVYQAINKRFKVFGNAYFYLDFKQRLGVSL